MPPIARESSFIFNYFVKKVHNKDIHLVVEFMESRECHSHVLLKKGVIHFVSRRPDVVCQGIATRLGGFLVLGYP
jgi:hypothetical protein